MEVVDINLAGISFRASTEWMFFPYEHFILARRDSKKGILKISLAEQTNGHAVTPSDLLRSARHAWPGKKSTLGSDDRPGGQDLNSHLSYIWKGRIRPG